MATQASAPTSPFGFFELNELDPEFRADPHTRLATMRDRCPVSRDPMMKRLPLTRLALLPRPGTARPVRLNLLHAGSTRRV